MIPGPAILILALAAGSAAALQPIEYNRDVRPILMANCFACHGADSAARKEELRLDRFDDAIKPREDSKPAIVPGKPDDSEMILRIESKDDPMPPEKSHKVLKAAEKQILRRWVAEGAQYQPHWAFIPPKRPELPAVKNSAWVRNPIDRFVLSSLDRQGLAPAPEADRRVLARRVSLDLTGLPPAPAQVEEFVADKAPGAYEKLVDRLLGSKRWGEHRARSWLDAARYADTNGFHYDNFREIWTYRDWVIKAFNRNVPFDQFTIEQLAGDLLPNATTEQKIASGFNRCNITTNEGGAIDEEYLVLYARDRTETTAQVWLGLTAGCAVCHDHKYDPFLQKDFYAMSAFFNNTTQKAMDGNVSDTAPSMIVPSRDDRTQWDVVAAKLGAARDRVAHRTTEGKSAFAAWMKNPPVGKLARDVPSKDLLAHLPLSEGDTKKIGVRLADNTVLPVGFEGDITWQPGVIADQAFTARAATTPELANVGDFERDQAFSYAVWIKVGFSRDGAVLARMDEDSDYRGWDLWLEKGRPGAHIVSKWPDDAFKVVMRKSLSDKRWSHVAVTYDGSSQPAGLKMYLDGELQDLEVQADSLRNSIRATVPFKIGQRNKASQLEGTGLQDLRIYGHALSQDEVRRLANIPRVARLAAQLGPGILEKSPEKSKESPDTSPDLEELYNRWLVAFDRDYQRASDELALLDTMASFIRSRGTVAHVMAEREKPPEAFVLQRGEYDKRRDKVVPATPGALPAMAAGLPRNRIGLARWLVSEAQPLTARVTVNRFWQEVFGTGIVKTTGDFGVAGEAPSNPELLDWLAVEFRESGWDMKKFFKMMVTSAAYRQAAIATPEKIAKDPHNTFLSRGPRFRMDGEMIRDYALAASGLLADKIGGPSARPYQPDGVWEAVAMPESNTRRYQRDRGENLYRRSLYTFWKRSAPPASLEIFNAPSREVCTVRRERTNTPLQALTTLNDEQFIEAARMLAERALRKSPAETARIAFMAEQVLARPLQPAESKIARSTLASLLRHYRKQPDAVTLLLRVGDAPVDAGIDQPALAAFTMLANTFLNLDEVLNK